MIEVRETHLLVQRGDLLQPRVGRVERDGDALHLDSGGVVDADGHVERSVGELSDRGVRPVSEEVRSEATRARCQLGLT